eukprot:CAMPEP_0119305230 /NCGR_PEP_ID=MMETSP1333-20130426/6277_1 /TAXON_ID=418940 /ORGANISM="Scyphosphaera apsteinii, Strain RCC1455" /LENGTH=204 /DNA_ID=CAMNT_0007308273 /DNA_START=165 /DNA_END=779 /DNA_ORIENTATION=-
MRPFTCKGQLQRRKAAGVVMVEPISTAVAFSLGAIPSAVLVIKKDEELRKAETKAEAAEAELVRIRQWATNVIDELELQAEVTDQELESILAAVSGKSRQYKTRLLDVKEKYDQQLSRLKDLVGDYSDQLELQQNRLNSKDLLVASVQSESAAIKERAQVLEEQLASSQAALSIAESKLKSFELLNPFAIFQRLINGEPASLQR